MLISLPAATGGAPFCYDTNLMLTGYLSVQNVQCPMLQNNLRSVLIALVWSVCFIILWTIGVVLTLKNLWKLRIITPGHSRLQAVNQAIKRQFARLMLLFSGGVILLLFIMSPTSAVFPGNARYLVGLLISTPALIAPLWDQSSHMKAMTSDMGIDDPSHKRGWFNFASFKAVLGRGILLIIGFVFLVGIVKADPNSAYVFIIQAGQIQAIAKRMALLSGHYKQFIFGKYVVYQPVNTH